MFTLNHNVLFPERMFSSQFSIVGGNKINEPLFVCWVGAEGEVFSSSSREVTYRQYDEMVLKLKKKKQKQKQKTKNKK